MNEMFEAFDPARPALSGAFAAAPLPSSAAQCVFAVAEPTAGLRAGRDGGHEPRFAVRLSLGLLVLALGAAFVSWMRGRGGR